jgi:hypothetical protein
VDADLVEYNSSLDKGKTVREVALRISGNSDTKVDEVVIGLYESASVGEIRLVDPYPPRSFIEYLFSFYSSWFWLIVVGLVLLVLTIYVFPQVAPFTWIRIGLGFLSSLYLPGFAFIETLYPQRTDLEELERFALGVGLSLALTPLIGFVLNYTPWGIRLDPITISISILTLLFGLTGVYRKFTYHKLMQELINDSKL